MIILKEINIIKFIDKAMNLFLEKFDFFLDI